MIADRTSPGTSPGTSLAHQVAEAASNASNATDALAWTAQARSGGEALAAELDDLRQACTDAQNALAAQDAAHRAEVAELVARLRAQDAAADADRDAHLRETSSAAKQFNELAVALEAAEAALEAGSLDTQQLEAQLRGVRGELDKTIDQQSAGAKEVLALRAQVAGLERELQDAQDAAGPRSDAETELRARIAELEGEGAELGEAKLSLEGELASLQQQFASAAADLASKQGQIEEILAAKLALVDAAPGAGGAPAPDRALLYSEIQERAHGLADAERGRLHAQLEAVRAERAEQEGGHRAELQELRGANEGLEQQALHAQVKLNKTQLELRAAEEAREALQRDLEASGIDATRLKLHNEELQAELQAAAAPAARVPHLELDLASAQADAAQLQANLDAAVREKAALEAEVRSPPPPELAPTPDTPTCVADMSGANSGPRPRLEPAAADSAAPRRCPSSRRGPPRSRRTTGPWARPSGTPSGS